MKHITLYILSAALFFVSCKKETETPETAGEVTVTFDARVGSSDFALNTEFTINNRTYQFNKLRYWVSNISLIDTEGKEHPIPNSYYLMEETGEIAVQDGSYTYPARKREKVTLANIPAGDYKTIKFSIGVDPVYNDNLSLQAGELSQLNGMTNISWMWHTSYIFSSISGTITDGSATKNIVAETGLNRNYRSTSIELPSPVRIGSSAQREILLQLDAEKLFNNLDLIATPVIGAAQAEEMSTLATNYTQAITAAGNQK